MLRIETAKVFEPLLAADARYRAAWGGRGGAKSHFFAELLVERCLLRPGTLACCIREIQRTLAQSSKRLIEDKIIALGVGNRFRRNASLIWRDSLTDTAMCGREIMPGHLRGLTSRKS
jgi:phage terminase large subunit